MAAQKVRSSTGTGLGGMVQSFRQDKREYTLMFVPHHGRNVVKLRLPIKALKITSAILCILMVVAAGVFFNFQQILNVANAEKAELSRLRQINANQSVQIEQLAKATAGLQEDMNRLNKLDADLRRLVNNEEVSTPSRAGTTRLPAAYAGQGGPVVKPQVEEVLSLVEDLKTAAKSREESLISVRDAIKARNARLAATPSIWPTTGEVTSRYGWRSSPFGWGSDWHPGIDIANDVGTPVLSTADGEVVFSGWYGGYGKMIQIDHGNGIVTIYGHNDQLLVNAGTKVKKGDIVAYMGNTGASTGSHVHYEVRVNGTAVNPANFL